MHEPHSSGVCRITHFVRVEVVMHSCFTSSIFAARTLDFAVKFGFVFRSEVVVFRRYVLALLSGGLLRKFEAYLVYLSLVSLKITPFT